MERRAPRSRVGDAQRRTVVWAVFSIVVLLGIIGAAIYLEKLTALPEPFELVPAEERGAARQGGARGARAGAPQRRPAAAQDSPAAEGPGPNHRRHGNVLDQG